MGCIAPFWEKKCILIIFFPPYTVILPQVFEQSLFLLNHTLKSADRMVERQLMAIWIVSSLVNVLLFFFSFFSRNELASVCLAPTEHAYPKKKAFKNVLCSVLLKIGSTR